MLNPEFHTLYPAFSEHSVRIESSFCKQVSFPSVRFTNHNDFALLLLIDLQQLCSIVQQILSSGSENSNPIFRALVLSVDRFQNRNILFIIWKPDRYQMQLMIDAHFHHIPHSIPLNHIFQNFVYFLYP